jgi:GPH family glycoside/pentoside/hexuronide:cation symporter
MQRSPLTPSVAAYGVGEMSITIGMVLFGLFALFFYGTVMKLSGVLVGTVSAAGLVTDAVMDPYIGHWSDNYRGRLGRRHGFMVAGAVTSGIAFWALLSPPPNLSPLGLFLWLLATTILFRFTSALFRIPYLGLGAELNPDYHGRTLVVGVRAFCGLCGTLGAAVLSLVVFMPAGDPGAKFAAENYARIGEVFGVAIVAAGLIAVLGTWSHRDAGRLPIGHGSVRPRFPAAFASAWSNRPFRHLWIGFTLFFVAVVLNATLALHYFTWYAGIPDTGTIGRIQIGFYVGALLGVLVWVPLGRRVEKRRLCLASMVGTAAILALATLLIGDGHLFGTANPAPLIAGSALAGLFAAGVWVLPGSMLADVAELDERQAGLGREGLYFGLMNFGEKVGAGVALLLAGALLDLFVGLAPSGSQSATATFRIGLLYGLAPALLLLCAAAAVAGYDLDSRAIGTVRSTSTRAGEHAPGPTPTRRPRRAETEADASVGT